MAETKKKTTTKKAETKVKPKKEEVKVEKVNDINAISPELIAMLTAQITEQVTNQLKATMSEPTESAVAENKPSKRRKVKQIDLPLDELVPVRSIFNGTVGFKPRSGRTIVWQNNGTVQNLTIQDILDMDATSSIYLRTPRLIVEDEEVCEYLGINDIVDMAEKVSDIDDFLQLDIKDIDSTLDNLPRGLRENIYGEIVRRIECDEIDSMRVVRLLRTKLKIDF